MSNFKLGHCPRCTKNHGGKLEEKREELRKAYGQVSMEVWEKMRLELEKMRLEFDELQNEMTGRRFRQESDFCGPEDGVITLRYYGRCHDCGLTVKFDHTHIIEDI